MANRLLTRKFLESMTFRPFTKSDYMGFGGVEGPCPMIAERDSFVVIIDGDYCELYVDGYEFGAFETVESIREMPL